MKLDDFLRMNPMERNQYIDEHGLSDEQRQELLRVNRIISSMLRMDSYRRGKLKRFKYIVRLFVSWLLR